MRTVNGKRIDSLDVVNLNLPVYLLSGKKKWFYVSLEWNSLAEENEKLSVELSALYTPIAAERLNISRVITGMQSAVKEKKSGSGRSTH